MTDWKPKYLHEDVKVDWPNEIYRRIVTAAHVLIFGRLPIDAFKLPIYKLPYVYPEIVHPVTGTLNGGKSRWTEPRYPSPVKPYEPVSSQEWTAFIEKEKQGHTKEELIASHRYWFGRDSIDDDGNFTTNNRVKYLVCAWLSGRNPILGLMHAKQEALKEYRGEKRDVSFDEWWRNKIHPSCNFCGECGNCQEILRIHEEREKRQSEELVRSWSNNPPLDLPISMEEINKMLSEINKKYAKADEETGKSV